MTNLKALPGHTVTNIMVLIKGRWVLSADERDTGDEPRFTWLGTAAFRIEHAGKVILIDPFLSRGERARPPGRLTPSDMADADFVFVSHGHFDHIADVPAILEASKAQACCSDVAAEILERKGVAASRIRRLAAGDEVDLGGGGVSVATCRHVTFDLPLVLKTLPGILREFRELLPNARGYPAGPVLVLTFDLGGLKVMHLGSLGLKPGDVSRDRIRPPDVLLIPLQGHTRICEKGAELATALRPRAVVPEHFDDFSPPISRYIDIEPFRRALAGTLPDCSYFEPEIYSEFTPEDIFAGEGGS